MRMNRFDIGILGQCAVGDFKFAVEQEFDCIELSTNPGAVAWFLRNITSVKQWLKYFPLQVSAIGYFAAEYQADPREFQNLLQVMDACKSLGGNIIHVGTGSGTGREKEDLCKAVEFLGRAIKEARTRNLRLALYTCKVSNFAWNPKCWPQLFERLPDLCLKYDPSHAYHSEEERDYLSEIRDWGEKIIHFHAKGGYLGTDGNRDPLGDPPPGKDQIDWRQVMRALIEVDYTGVLCIEMHSDRYSYDDAYDALVQSRNYLREVNSDVLKELTDMHQDCQTVSQKEDRRS